MKISQLSGFIGKTWVTVGGCILMGLHSLAAGPQASPPPVPVFNVDEFDDQSKMITHPHFPLEPGSLRVFEGKTKEGFERVVTLVAQENKMILGVACRVVIDRAYLDGNLIEETFDWYAQDRKGNVWYFGEESHEIEDGKVVSSHGSWEAGVDGAKPGYIMLATPKVGDRYRQEYYAGEAEDMAEVTALDATLTLSDGTTQAQALRTLEWTPLEPAALENKYYLAGIGLVREEKADGSEPIDLARRGMVLKEAKMIIEHNATDSDTGFQGFIDSEGWQKLDVVGPEGEVVLTFEGLGQLGELGLTELFFETVEPANAEVPIIELLEKLPDGSYTIAGPATELGESTGDTVGAPVLEHQIPRGPKLLTPKERETVDARKSVVISWEPVSRDLDGESIQVNAYQLIIEKDEAPHPHMIGKSGLSAYVPANVTRVTLPANLLEPDQNYGWEVLAIGANGNQTLSSSKFNTGPNQNPPPGPDQDPPKLKAAKLNIEHNATDHDTGFQGFVDSEGWQKLEVTGPTGELVLRFEAHGELGDLGMTELFFESVEPENAEVSIAEMLAKLPAGNYTFSGRSMQNGESGGVTTGTAWLTHAIPAGAKLLTPSEGEVVRAEELTMSWSPVSETIDGKPLKLIAYQLIIQNVEPPDSRRIGKIGVSFHLPPSVTNVQVPKEIISPGTTYQWEVLAIEESGNQTLSSGKFETAPRPTSFALSLDTKGNLTWSAIPSRQYEVEMRESLSAGAWKVVGKAAATTSTGTLEVRAIMATNSSGYFRVKEITP